MTRDVNTACARALVDEWARAGVAHAALAPGSRSAPLALALAEDRRLTVHVHLDERSAAFFALGVAKASGRPALVLCTSGTAAANLHPAVLEARHSHTGLLVCTADRPAELRHTGAPQTTDQVKLYGGAVRFFAEIAPEDHPEAFASWRPLAARALAEAAGPPAGPVHLNLAFREPLVPDPAQEVPDVPGRPDGRPWVESRSAPNRPTSEDVARLAAQFRSVERGLVVAGWGVGEKPAVVDRFAALMQWPLLADPLSGLRRVAPWNITTYEALLRAPGFSDTHRPDLVIRLGGPPTSKLLGAWLDSSVRQLLFDPDGAWLDPGRTAAEHIRCDPTLLLEEVLEALSDFFDRPSGVSPWFDAWMRAEMTAYPALQAFMRHTEISFEGTLAREVAHACWYHGGVLVVASSMPVRDIEAFAGMCPTRVLANRGVNGIDGFTSTVLGVATAVAPVPTVALCGDLAFLHDASGLLAAARRPGLTAVLVVVDNDGGGIFSFLPQASAVATDHFEELFGTPHGLDLVAVATAFGVPAVRVKRLGELTEAIDGALRAGGVHVVIVPADDRSANVAAHRRAWQAVNRALETAGVA
jgi:2-succinyl-5-enolpyruvyl-6-hydroxy-3-cyclohexene-1-carboxylate synthase